MVTSRLHRAGANFLALQPLPTPCIHQNKKKKEAPIITLPTAHRPKTTGCSRAALCQSRGGFYQCLWAFPLSGSYDLSGAGNSDDSFLWASSPRLGKKRSVPSENILQQVCLQGWACLRSTPGEHISQSAGPNLGGPGKPRELGRHPPLCSALLSPGPEPWPKQK